MLAVGIGVAVVAAFLFSTLYYIALSPLEQQALKGAAPERSPAVWKAVVEFARTAVTAGVFAWIALQTELLGFPDSLLLAIILWAGFPLVLLSGSIIWEKTAPASAALHAGDWLLKLLVIGTSVGLLH
ncbi:DUF1761 domain-containing protein [Okibacterium endophyticum]